jgi:Tfx family DNA-binding protein
MDDGDAETAAEIDPAELLARAGFDAEQNVLTRQSVIADRLGTSRATVSSVESSARENVAKARETVSFADALSAPVRVRVENGTDLYDVPEQVYDACDEAGVKVGYAAPELMKIVSDAAGDAVHGREVRAELLVGVTSDGQVRVRRAHEE